MQKEDLDLEIDLKRSFWLHENQTILKENENGKSDFYLRRKEY